MDHPLSKWDSNKIYWLFVTLHVKYFLSLHRKSMWKVRGKNVTVQFYFVGAMLMRKQTSQTLSHKAWNNILSILPFASVYQPLHPLKKKFSSREDSSIGKQFNYRTKNPPLFHWVLLAKRWRRETYLSSGLYFYLLFVSIWIHCLKSLWCHIEALSLLVNLRLPLRFIFKELH